MTLGVVKHIADYFRATPKDKTTDHYGVLSSLLATGDYISSIAEMYSVFKNSVYTDFMSGKVKPVNKYVQHAVDAYREYLKALPSHEYSLEKAQPFSTILLALESIKGNIVQIEDNFQPLFGSVNNDTPETSLRSSSLIVVGYLEKADCFATWLGGLVQHMTADGVDMIAPFRTKELLSKAAESSEFAAFNLNKWNYRHQSLLSEVKEMQKKGSDLAIQADNGAWIDQYAHDDQFSPMEQNLMAASLRSPVMIAITMKHDWLQDRLDLMTSRKDWLTSKIVLEQSKLRGLDPESPEYKRLKKATDHYSDLASKYEQRIERMRA